ncbi:hypothetical protein TNCV_1700101 [Trichonephila clavipes]|nr:hypothetical protein TNCV_1700101 [Trichonephila clavipes]
MANLQRHQDSRTDHVAAVAEWYRYEATEEKNDREMKSLGSDLNSGEGMGVCKCVVPVKHVNTLRRRTESPLERLVEDDLRHGPQWRPRLVLDSDLIR